MTHYDGSSTATINIGNKVWKPYIDIAYQQD